MPMINYKHHTLLINHVLTLIPGAGQGFLTTALLGEIPHQMISQFNEYKIDYHPTNRTVMNTVDDCIPDYFDKTNYILTEKDLSKLRNASDEFLGYSTIDLLRSHHPTYFLTKIFDTKIKEYTNININGCKWIVRVLDLVKTEFSPIDANNLSYWKLSKILSEYRKIRTVEPSDEVVIKYLEKFSENIHPYCNIALLSVYALRYVFQCINKGIYPNVDHFKEYNSFMLHAYPDENKEILKVANNHIIPLVGTYTDLNYVDLFFDLNVPSTECWSKVDKNQIRNYSLANIDILSRYSDWLLDVDKDKLQEKINTYREKLK